MSPPGGLLGLLGDPLSPAQPLSPCLGELRLTKGGHLPPTKGGAHLGEGLRRSLGSTFHEEAAPKRTLEFFRYEKNLTQSKHAVSGWCIQSVQEKEFVNSDHHPPKKTTTYDTMR